MSGFRLVDKNGLTKELQRLSKLDLYDVTKNNMTEIYNRGKQNSKTKGLGTPVDTGELRTSLGQTFGAKSIEVGYAKSYAPHVEFGHRTRGGGWVPGQAFLKANVDAQKPILKKDLESKLKGK